MGEPILETSAHSGSTEFETKVIAHPILKTVFDEIWAVIRNPKGLSLLLAVGPTGVGKTTLISKLENKLFREFENRMREDAGFVPVVRVEAPSHDNGNFHWGDFYVRFLEAVQEPMIKHKTTDESRNPSFGRQKITGTNAVLRRAVENCIRHRSIKAIIIDEAQHLTKVSNAKRMLDQMDTIKSLASKSGALVILAGTYELLPLLNQSAQLARRTRCVHFPRYQICSTEDRQIFGNAISTFEDALPFEKSSDLRQYSDYLYQGSLGCIGILKDWLTRALSYVLNRKGDTLKRCDLEATAHTNDSLLQILREIEEGESQLNRNVQSGVELRRKLGLDSKIPNNDDEKVRNKSRRLKVGERKPVRDPVGVVI